MLTLADLRNKIDPPSPAPPSHKAATAGGDITSHRGQSILSLSKSDKLTALGCDIQNMA